MSCLICNTKLSDDKVIVLKSIAIENLIKVSHARRDDLAEALCGLESITLHIKCKKLYHRFKRTDGDERIYRPLRLNWLKEKQPEEPTSTHFEYVPIPSESTAGIADHSFEVQYVPTLDFHNETKVKEEYLHDNSEFKNECETTLCNDSEYIEDDPSKPFAFHEKCLFCGLDRHVEHRNKLFVLVRDVRLKPRISRALTAVATPYALNILRRIQDIDLIQVNAHYHLRCYRSFIPKGKPKDFQMRPKLAATLEKIYRYVEQRNRPDILWQELIDYLSKDDHIPTYATVLKYLRQKYKDKVHRISLSGFKRLLYLGELDISKTSEETKKELIKNAIKRYAKDKKQKPESSQEVVKEDDDSLAVEDCTASAADVSWSDAEDPEPEEANKEQLCGICLSYGRKLGTLGEYADVYRKISADVVTDFNPEAFCLCWECKAALRNIHTFHQKIRDAQHLLNTNTIENPTSLSNLVVTPIELFDIESTTPTECADELNEDDIKQEVDEIYIQNDDDDDMQALRDDNEHMDDNAINDYSEDDAKSDTEKNTVEIPLEVPVEVKVKKRNELDLSVIIPSRSKRRAAIKAKPTRALAKETNFLEVEEYFQTDGVKPNLYKKKRRDSSSSSEESDPEWQDNSKVKKYKNKEIDSSKHYTIDVQNFETNSKIIREPIESDQLDGWLESERNSGYFRTIKRDSKCEKCISFVAEDHFKLCHSKKHQYVCHICESTFPSEKEMATHVSDHYFIFACDICGYKCYNHRHIQEHVETHRKVVLCLICTGTFPNTYSFGEHFNAIHRQAICNDCNQTFKDKKAVEKHIVRRHMKLKPAGVGCKLCDAVFSSHKRRRAHMAKIHAVGVKKQERPYCVDCDKHFASESTYRTHLELSAAHVSEEKRLALSLKRKERGQKRRQECPVCQKWYESCHLQNHIDAVHNKEYKFKCDDCDKMYVVKNKLLAHRKYAHEGHQKKRNKICSFCGRGFTEGSVLKNHIRLHTGEKPFVCHYPGCSSRFAQKVALRSHIKHIHEKQPRTPSSTAHASA